MIKRLFSPPLFDNEGDNFLAKFINGFAWAAIALLAIAIAIYAATPTDANALLTVIVLSGLILAMLLALYVLHKGNLSLSAEIIVVLGWLGLGIQAFTADGVRDVIIVAYIAISLLASIIINWRAGSVFMLLSIIAVWVLALLEVNGILKPRSQEPIAFSRDLSIVFIAIAVLIYFNTTSLRRIVNRANQNEESLLAANENLLALNQTLEERVTQRTAELEKTDKYHAWRARQLEAISQVTRVITSIQDPDTLLPYVTQVISEQFGIYHTGIFLLDKEREFAVLRATNSDGGRRMLMRGHKLRVGQTGIVGFVTATGQPRIALDVGADATHFENPDLPNTHSEIALPLRYAGQIIGALDVQSTEPNAFGQDDIETLLTLADQVSAAIRNTLTFDEIRKELAEYKKSVGENVHETWKVMRPKSLGLGFEYAKSIIRPLEKQLISEDIQDAIAQNKSVLSNDESDSTLAVPIRLRGKVVGVINLRANDNYKITNDDMDIVELVIERLSLAMETASLIQATQHRADVERVTTDISSKISSSSRFETILQTAAQELSRALGGSDVIVQIDPIANKMNIEEG